MAKRGICEIQDCSNTSSARGWCRSHYTRWLRHGDPNAGGVMKRLRPRVACLVDGCEREAASRGACESRYVTWRYHGFAPDKIPNNFTRGLSNKRINRLGYVEWTDVSHPCARGAGTVLEHRAVMADKIGRPLEKGENVHHINGDRSDNRPGNLELWVTAQPSGQRPQDLVQWAREILARYEPLVGT